jgi:hypothetical protein
MFHRLLNALFILLTLFYLTNCQHDERPPSMVQPEIGPIRGPFERNDPHTPFLTIRLYYGDAMGVEEMIRSQDDAVRHFRGLHRVGDGIISVGLKSGKGWWLPSHECGGHIFVEGKTGETYQIVVRNETRNRMEIVLAADGHDVLTGAADSVHNAGLLFEPGETKVIGRSRDKLAPSLTFGTGRPDPGRPVIHAWMRSAAGSIVLAAFNDRNRLPWEGNHRTTHTPPMNQFPARKHQPEARTFEYR